MQRPPRQRGIRHGIIDFLMNHPHKDFSVESIALGADLPLMAVKNAMSKLVKDDIVAIGVTRGFYHYNGTEKPEIQRGTMMEVLKTRDNGEVIAIDENGNFWVARKVDL